MNICQQILTSLTKSAAWYTHKPVWVMLFLGFSAGVPLYLVFGSLSLWLREAGVARATVTFFSWAVLGYSFKFVWAPLVDRLPLPFLTRLLGRRRGWLLLSQCSVIASIIFMASTNPASHLVFMAVGAVLLGFSSATQDIVIDAYRIEAGEPTLQALMSSTYVAGYRIGMMVAGAWALLLAEHFGSTAEVYSYVAWQKTYFIMAFVMLVGVVTTLIIKEPDTSCCLHTYSTHDYTRFLCVFIVSVFLFILAYRGFNHVLSYLPAHNMFVGFVMACLHMLASLVVAICFAYLCAKKHWVNHAMIKEGYIAPFTDFFMRYGRHAFLLLLLVCFYRVSDIILGVISNVFYQDMGYSKSHIASITKLFGVVVTILGALLGGVIALRLGVMRSLLAGAVLVSLTNLLFLWLANVGESYSFFAISLPFIDGEVYRLPLELTLVITADNLAQGLAIAAFIGWLSSLTNVAFSATQYAIFSSLMTLLPKLLGGYAGLMVDTIGYHAFFIFASALGIPVVLLILWINRRQI